MPPAHTIEMVTSVSIVLIFGTLPGKLCLPLVHLQRCWALFLYTTETMPIVERPQQAAIALSYAIAGTADYKTITSKFALLVPVPGNSGRDVCGNGCENKQAKATSCKYILFQIKGILDGLS